MPTLFRKEYGYNKKRYFHAAKNNEKISPVNQSMFVFVWTQKPLLCSHFVLCASLAIFEFWNW